MTAGRPLKFQSVKLLQKRIDEYFRKCDKKSQPYTITGLALYLDTSRQTLLEYEGEVEGREEKSLEFADTIKRAKLRCESYAESKLFDPKIRAVGAIFALKNYGWKDEQTTNVVLPIPLDEIPEDNSVQENKGTEEKN